MRAESDRNVSISPLGLHSVLMLLWLGAAGETRRDIGQALKLAEGCTDTANRWRQRSTVLKSATSMWTQGAVGIVPAFYGQIERYDNAVVKSLPRENAADAINRWVASATQGKIVRIVNVLDPAVRLVFVNALYFAARWLFPFDERLTQPGTFHLSNAKNPVLPFMTRVADLSYRSDGRCEWIRLPYAGAPLAMDVLLPKPGVPLKDLCGTLLQFGEPGSALPPPIAGRIRLPRFKVSMADSMKPPLSALGLSRIFDLARADFSAMVAATSSLAVGDVRQSVFIAVDEAGTEAAAATSASMVGSLPQPVLRFDMNVDRPFLIAIRDTNDGLVLFLSAVREPQA